MAGFPKTPWKKSERTDSARGSGGLLERGELPYFCINGPFVINRELKMLEVKAQKKLYVSPDYKASGKHTGQE